MNKEKKDNPDYLSQGEVLRELNLNYITFERYCRKLGIEGEREGRCTYYSRLQIQMFKQLLTEQVRAYIRNIERLTGKEVRLF